MARKYLNNYVTLLSAAITATDTTMTVGTPPPALAAGDFCRLQLSQRNAQGVLLKQEFVDVTAVSGNVLTITRAAEFSTALAWDAGARVELTETAATFSGIPDASGLLPTSGGTLLDAEITRYSETIAAATTTIDRADGGIQTLTLTADSALTWTINNGEKIQLYLTPAGFNVTNWGVTYWMTGVPTLSTENMIVVEKVGGNIYAWDGGSR
jgi:hypothetical protein